MKESISSQHFNGSNYYVMALEIKSLEISVIEYCYFLSLNQHIIFACWTALAAAEIQLKPIAAD
jgi:hypothetical protein